MRTNRREMKLLLAGLVLALGSCNPTSLDNSDSADVVLEVLNIPQVPPITAASVGGGACTFTVTNMTVTLRNQPKNTLAGDSPFNDILVESVTLSYEWDDLTLTTLPRTLAVGGTVPANGSQTVSFPPIALGDLLATYAGHSASITMAFTGQTVSGKGVSATGRGAVVSVNSCACPDRDGDGLCDDIDRCPGCNNTACTGASWCGVAGHDCTNANPTCP